VAGARTYEYDRMTWPEIREAAAQERVVMSPRGTVEQHASVERG